MPVGSVESMVARFKRFMRVREAVLAKLSTGHTRKPITRR